MPWASVRRIAAPEAVRLESGPSWASENGSSLRSHPSARFSISNGYVTADQIPWPSVMSIRLPASAKLICPEMSERIVPKTRVIVLTTGKFENAARERIAG